MSSRPKRSTLAPSRFSPSLEESPKVPSNKSSQPRHNSISSSKDGSSSKKSTPVKKDAAPKQIAPSPNEKPSESVQANDPKMNLFISKTGRLSIPSAKVSLMSLANFGRKCLNLGDKIEAISTKRRSLLSSSSEPVAKKPHLDKDIKPEDITAENDNIETSVVKQEEVPDMHASTSGVESESLANKSQIPFNNSSIMAESSSQISAVNPTPNIMPREPVVFEGRKSRNKSKPLSEFAPELLPNRFSVGHRQAQQKELQMKRKAETETKRREKEATRIRRERERLAQLRRQEQSRREQSLHQHLLIPQSVTETPANLLNRSAKKSLTIKIEDFDSEASTGMRSSKSISSPAVFAKRYQAYGTRTSDAILGNSRFYSRMEHRKYQNPLSYGLVPIKRGVTTNDYFYREVLLNKAQPNEPKTEMDGEDQIDIDVLSSETNTFGNSKVFESDDEILIKNPAFDCVVDIRYQSEEPLLFKELSSVEKDVDDTSPPIIDQLLEECIKNESIMYSHLRVIIPIIVNQRLVELSTLNVVGGCSLFYSQTLKNATRLRDRLCLFTKKRILGIEDAHAYLLKRLPDEYLASYLNILRFLKVSGSSLPIRLLDHPVDSEVQIANEFIREFVNTKIVDPNLRYGKCMDISPISNVSLVLVYPQVSMASQTVIKHAHENMFRNLLPAAVRCVEKLELKFDKDVDPKTLTHMCLSLIRERVQELVRRRPDDHVFLAGWGISSLLNMQAIQKVQGVTGVLNFAFPLRSYLGFRGTVDDSICVSYCPSLFVVGDCATNVNIEELQLMREYMICESGLVVVGGADNNLYVSPLKLSVERISQHCVDRIIFEHVIDFMRQTISEGGMSAKERRQYLKPVKFPNSFDVDLNTLKGRASGFVPKLRQPKDAVPKKEKKGILPSNPPTPLSTLPSPSKPLPSPALSGSTSFHRQPPPLLSVASTSIIKPPQRMELYGSNELIDARTTFNNALRRQSMHAPVSVSISEPKNLISMPPLTTSAKKETLQQPVSIHDVHKMMSQEAEAAAASLTNCFVNENEDVDDSGF